MKKKIFAAMLSIAMLTNLTTTAFAADQTNASTGSYSNEVKGSYAAGDAGSVIYSVDITWKGLSFTYEAAGKQWNPAKHIYEVKDEAGWADNTGTITIINHSNAAISVTPSYTVATGYTDASMTFSTSSEANLTSLTVASADNGTDGAAGSAVMETITVTPGGSLPEGTTDATIGTITINISGVTP